jgi:hypothetical protein
MAHRLDRNADGLVLLRRTDLPKIVGKMVPPISYIRIIAWNVCAKFAIVKTCCIAAIGRDMRQAGRHASWQARPGLGREPEAQ